jgi:RNA polymerase sigma-70 factor (ECF subfamily)
MAHDDCVTEDELTRRFMSGDVAALCALFDRHEQLLRNRIAQLLPSHLRRRISPSDVLQESRMVVLDRRLDFELRGQDAFLKWVFGIVANKVRRAVQWHAAVAKRSTQREVTRGQRIDTGQVAGAVPSPSEVAVEAELRNSVRRAMRSLPEDYREVLRLSREEHLSLREVGERMGRSHAATRKLYGRALSRLGRALRELGGVSRG